MLEDLKKITSFLFFIFIFASCGTEEFFSDEDEDENEYYLGFHYQGVSCSQCHSPDAGVFDYEYEEEKYYEKDEDELFNIGGTIFNSIDAQDGDVNSASLYHYVVLKTEYGSYKANIGAGIGNFYLNKGISQPFLPQVYDNRGNLVNSALTYHKPSHVDCNSCHTSEGRNGAPGRIVSYDYYGGRYEN